MKVVLLKDVAKIGRRGELKDVSEGYANNFLIRKGLAAVATAAVQEQITQEAKQSADRQEKESAKLQQLKSALEKRTFTLKVKVGDKGQVFGGVHEKDIAAVINGKLNSNLDKGQIDTHRGIKTLGEHEINIKLGHGLTAVTKLNIEAL